MPPIIWDSRASRDLTRLYDLLAPNGASTAARAMRAILDAVKVLRMHPEIGRLVEDLTPDFRELIVEFGQSAYIVRYRFDGDRIFILAVRHGREAEY